MENTEQDGSEGGLAAFGVTSKNEDQLMPVCPPIFQERHVLISYNKIRHAAFCGACRDRQSNISAPNRCQCFTEWLIAGGLIVA